MYLSSFRMVKATSLWNQLTGCFSLNQNFIVHIAGSGKRAGRPGSVRRHVFVHRISPVQSIVATEEFSSPAHLDNISPLWSSSYACDHLGLAIWIFQVDGKKYILLSTFTCIRPTTTLTLRCRQNLQFGDFTLLFCRVR